MLKTMKQSQSIEFKDPFFGGQTMKNAKDAIILAGRGRISKGMKGSSQVLPVFYFLTWEVVTCYSLCYK